MARRRTAEAAQTLPELLVAEQADLNPDATAQAVNEHSTTAASAIEASSVETSPTATPTTEREPGDEPPRPQLPNPMSWISDTIAQVTFRTAREPYQAELVFGEGKPSAEVRTLMKDAGFRWNAGYEAWTRPIGYQAAAQDREIARRTAVAVIQQIREEKGVPARHAETAPAF